MKSNYSELGEYIREVNERNSNLAITNLLGVSMEKTFIQSVANLNGVDMSVYKVLRNEQLACKLMSVGRDEKLPVDLYREQEPSIVSSAYYVFEPKDKEELLPEYLMMWLCRPENDRYIGFISGGDVRGGISWETFCSLPIKVPSISKQKEIVKEYNVIQNRITLNQQLIQKLEETSQAIYVEFAKQNLDESTGTLLDYIETANTGLDAIKRAPIVDENTGIRCLRIQDVSRDANFNDWGFTKVENNNFKKFQLKKNDILVARTGATVGGNIFIRKELNAVFNNGLIRIRANKKRVHPNILQVFFKTKEFVEHINSIAFGTSTQPNIQIGELLSFQVAFPSIEFQAGFTEYLIKIDNYKYELMEQTNLLEKLKDLLLSKLATIDN